MNEKMLRNYWKKGKNIRKKPLKELYELDATVASKSGGDWEDEKMPLHVREWILERILKIIQLVVASKPKKVLDVGCGDGYILSQIMLDKSMEDSVVVGLDISRNWIKRARLKLLGMNNVNLVIADAEALPFKKDIFDAVIATEVLEHIPDVEKCVDEIGRVLAPEGKVFISVPNKYNFYEIICKTIKGMPRTNWAHVRLISYWSLKHLFEGNNFKLTYYKSIGLPIIDGVLNKIVKNKPTNLRKVFQSLISKTPLKYFSAYMVFVFVCIKRGGLEKYEDTRNWK